VWRIVRLAGGRNVGAYGVSTRSNLELRLGDAARWDALFRVLAMARWRPFLGEMGVPALMAAAPEAIGACAQTYVLERSLTGPSPTDAAVANLSRRLDMLRTALSCVADAYGAEVADEFVVWSQRTVVGVESAGGLALWAALLPGLCVDGESSPCVALDAEVVRRCCLEISAYLSPEALGEVDARLAAARGEQPTTAYEDQLNAEVAYAAGNGRHVLDALDLAAELIEAVIRAERTWRVWTAMSGQLADAERASLLEWGRCRAEAAGLSPPASLPT
jgi:hypothetical protein